MIFFPFLLDTSLYSIGAGPQICPQASQFPVLSLLHGQDQECHTHILPIQALGGKKKTILQLPFLYGYRLDFFREACNGLAIVSFFLSAATKLGDRGWAPQDKPMVFHEKKK